MSLDLPAALEPHAAFLAARGAGERPHSGRNLLAHLAGTWRLLAQWGNPDSVCLAGLYHSVYGTNAFQHETLPLAERAAVQGLAGVEAEALAYVFCCVARPRALLRAAYAIGDQAEARLSHRRLPAQQLPVSRAQLRALLELEAANLLEQGSHGPALRELFLLDLDGGAWLSAGARQALKETLRAGLAAAPRSAWPQRTRELA
jgi:hypothetical protein